jgi:predicted transcriptional regulator
MSPAEMQAIMIDMWLKGCRSGAIANELGISIPAVCQRASRDRASFPRRVPVAGQKRNRPAQFVFEIDRETAEALALIAAKWDCSKSGAARRAIIAESRRL